MSNDTNTRFEESKREAEEEMAILEAEDKMKIVDDLAEIRQRYHALWCKISEENPKWSIAKVDHKAKMSEESKLYNKLRMQYDIMLKKTYE